jgi:hypothetical protein
VPARRNTLTICLAAVLATVLAAVIGTTGAGTAGAQAAAGACDGDVVSATINAPSLPAGGWSVTDACVPARDYFTGSYQDAYPFALGISSVTYDDGHVGRLALLSIQLSTGHSVTVVGMEDPATATLRFAGSVEPATLSSAGVSMSGQGIAFPPLELATVRLDLRDVSAPWPDWATTTTTPSAGGSTTVPPTSLVPTSLVPTSLLPTTLPSTTLPTTTVPSTTVPVTTVPPAGN